MESGIRIETTQNVEIDYTIAGIGDRVVATLIDYVILIGYMMGIWLLIPLFTQPGNGFLAIFVILFLPVVLYDLLCEIFMNGQSIGKRLLKIKVVKLDGSQPTIGDYFLRWLLRFIDILLLMGSVAILTILINGKGQRLGDLAAGTTVVKLDSSTTLDDTILTIVEERYVPVFKNVSRLTDQDLATVKEVLNAYIENAKISNHIAYRTKAAIEKKIGEASDLLPRTFLETVLKDYNHFVNEKSKF